MVVIRKPSPGEIIATSTNQIVLPKCGGTKIYILYSPDPPFLHGRLEGGSGFETVVTACSEWVQTGTNGLLAVTSYLDALHNQKGRSKLRRGGAS